MSYKRTKKEKYTRKIPHTQIIQKQLTHERQCHRAQQPIIQNTTRNRQQIAARYKQQEMASGQTNKHTR
jgi:hypothetical protein